MLKDNGLKQIMSKIVISWWVFFFKLSIPGKEEHYGIPRSTYKGQHASVCVLRPCFSANGTVNGLLYNK